MTRAVLTTLAQAERSSKKLKDTKTVVHNTSTIDKAQVYCLTLGVTLPDSTFQQ